MYEVEELLEIIERRLSNLKEEYGVPDYEVHEIMNYAHSLKWAQRKESAQEIKEYLDKF